MFERLLRILRGPAEAARSSPPAATAVKAAPPAALSRDPWNPWGPLLARHGEEWARAKKAARGGPRVLIAPGAGGYQLGSLVESSLAVALTLRGAEVEVLLCDSALPACQLTEVAAVSPEGLRKGPPQPRCATCEPGGRKVFEPLGLPIRRLGELVSAEEAAQALALSRSVDLAGLASYCRDGLAVGEHSVAGALRYFARGDFEGERHAGEVQRAYFRSALLTVRALENLLAGSTYQAACFNHGIYVPQGLIGEVCRKRGLRVVAWNPAYRESTFIFSHGDSYHHTMISEPTGLWERLPWSSRLEREALDYLESRRKGTRDWIWFHDEPREDAAWIAREVGLDPAKPVVSLLTNVMWDARLHYRSNAFPDMLAWVLETIRRFARRPELQLAIRIHPAELRGGVPSRQLLKDEIRKAFPALPPNVFVVGPESQVSTYALAEMSNAVIVYNTKTGIEVSSRGLPVIVAGEAWIRGKGFSLDASSPEEYFAILDRLPLPGRLSPDQLERARKYAYHFFFRRMVPLPFISQVKKGGKFQVTCGSLEPLRRGGTRGLDVICDGILEGTPFVYPAEELG